MSDDALNPTDRGHTNNVGELRGLLQGIREAEAIARQRDRRGGVRVYTDSTYAILTAAAMRRGRSANAVLRSAVRRAIDRVAELAGHGWLRLCKVRGHSGREGNDIADALATEGRNGRAMPSAGLLVRAARAAAAHTW